MTEKKKSKKKLTVLLKVFGWLVLLIIVVHTIAVMVTGASVRKAKEAMMAAGYPMRISEIIPPQLEDNKNAAIELKKIFGLLTLGSEEMYSPGKLAGQVAKEHEELLKFHDKEIEAPYSDKELTQLAKHFSREDSKRIFQLIRDGAAKEEAQFKRDYSAGPELLLPELGLQRKVCQMLSVRAKYESQKENKAEALRLNRECLIIGNHLKREPFLISQLVRLSNLEVSLATLRFISTFFELKDSELDDLNKLLMPYTDHTPLIKSIHGERFIFGQWFFEERNTVELSWFGEPFGAAFFRRYHWYPVRPIFNSDYSSYLNLMRAQTQLLENDFSLENFEDMDRKVLEEISGLSFITKMVAPQLSRVRLQLEKSKSLQEMTHIAIACNQYNHRKGRYPMSLDDLDSMPIESVTGKPYRFLRSKKEIYIYSGFSKYVGSLIIDIDGKTETVHGCKVNFQN